MTKRPERNFFEQMKRNMPKIGIPMDLGRVENTAITGWPDVNYCIGGIEGHAELKAWERIRLSGRFTIPKLRPEQAAWLYRRSSIGGRAYLLCRINKDVVLLDGRLVPALFDKTKHLDWEKGQEIATLWLKAPINWAALAKALVEPPAPQTEVDYKLGMFRSRTV